MKILLTFVILLISSASFAQFIANTDSSHVFRWETQNEQWRKTTITHNEYDINENQTSHIYYSIHYATGEVDPYYKSTYKYNLTNNYKTEESVFEWFDNAWNPYYLFTWEMIERNDSTIEVFTNSNANSGQLDFYYKQEDYKNEAGLSDKIVEYRYENGWNKSNLWEYTYDTENQLIEWSLFDYVDSSNTWKKISEVTYDYDDNGNLLSKVNNNLIYNTNIWKIGSRNLYEYNSDNQEISWTYQVKDDNNWVNDFRYETYYPDEFTKEYVRLDWSSNNNQWNSNSKTVTIRNSKNQIVRNEVYYWFHQWTNDTKNEYEYNEDDGYITVTSYEGDRFNNWERDFKYIFFLRSSEDMNMNGTSIPIATFPNPAVDVVNMVIPDELMNGKAHLFNSQGQLLEQYDITESMMTLSISHLNTGVYFFKIFNGDKVSTVRIVKSGE